MRTATIEELIQSLDAVRADRDLLDETNIKLNEKLIELKKIVHHQCELESLWPLHSHMVRLEDYRKLQAQADDLAEALLAYSAGDFTPVSTEALDRYNKFKEGQRE